MIEIELIICYKDKTWENEIFFNIDEDIPKVDEMAIDWLADNEEKFLKYTEDSNVIYIGVFSWGDSG